MENDDWHNLIVWADFIIFFFFLCSVSYLFIFAIFSFKKHKGLYTKTKKKYRYLVVFTSGQIDERIYQSMRSFLTQTYPKKDYDIALVSRKVSESSINGLKDFPVTLVQCPGGNPPRARMLEAVVEQVESTYDIIVIMKPGNTVDPTFLEEINKAYYSGEMAIQTHRVSKNTKTNTAILNSVSEEINNSIFRRGHVNMGFSSGLIGAGMAFNYKWFKQNISKVKQDGLTKQLEVILLKQGIFIEYLENVYTFDEKGSKISDFNQQRQNWYSAKRYTFMSAIKDFPKALLAGNFDFCDKIIQWVLPSRFILVFMISLIAALLILVDWTLSIKWFGLFIFLLLVFDLSIPSKLRTTRTMFALIAFPLLFLSTLINSLRFRRN